MDVLPTEEFPSMTYVASCVSGNTFIRGGAGKKQSFNGKEVLILT